MGCFMAYEAWYNAFIPSKQDNTPWWLYDIFPWITHPYKVSASPQIYMDIVTRRHGTIGRVTFHIYFVLSH